MRVLVYKFTFLFVVDVVLPLAALLGGYSPWRARAARRIEPPLPRGRALPTRTRRPFAGPPEVQRHPAW